MAEPIRWGILGSGRSAARFAAALNGTNDAELIAVGSRELATANDFAAKHNVKAACGSYKDLVAIQEVDVIYVATPHFRHVEDCGLCLEAGKAVLCERPFSINPDEAQPVLDVARSRKLFLMEGMWSRFLPAIVKLRELVETQAIGDVQFVAAGGGFIPDISKAPHIFDPEHGGGALLDSGIDLVAMATMLLGKPHVVNSLGTISSAGVDEQDGIVLSFPKGRMASLYVTTRSRQLPFLTILGTDGRIDVDVPMYAAKGLTVERFDGETERFDLPFEGNGYLYEALEVARCLRGGMTESPLMTIEETERVLNITNEIRLQIGLRFPME